MPSLGSDMDAGTLVKWRRNVGDHVKKGDILAEVETDKGIIEVETFVPGTLEKLVVEPGAKVPVGTVLAILADGGTPAPAPTPPAAPPPAAAPAPAPAAAPAPSAAPRASPLARRRARELGVDLASLQPTKDGVISLEDIERAAAAPKLSPEKRMRRAIAATMSRAKREIPHFYLRRTVDVSVAFSWLEAHNSGRAPEERVIFGALLVRAVARAARAVPEVNARFEGEEAKAVAEIHVGVAISLRNGGLVAPAIHDADKLSVDELMRALTDKTSRARAGTLRSSEMSDGTITVTSLGERGVDEVFPIVFPPQVAMVGAGVVRTRPWVENGAVVARPLIDLTLAVDHRVTDGHRASRFLLEMEKALTTAPEES